MQKRWWGMVSLAVLAGLGCGAASPDIAEAVTPRAADPKARSPIESALERVDGYFITQYRHARFNPGVSAGSNANCGPTSLAMALRAFGAEPAGLDSPAKAQELVRRVRQAMTGEVDESCWTYPIQVLEGARSLGLKAEIVQTLPRIRSIMAKPGRLMVLNLNPSPAYVDKLSIKYAGGHFALLTRLEGDRAYLSDPLAPEPIVISLRQLETALTTPLGRDPNGREVAAYNGGVALWR